MAIISSIRIIYWIIVCTTLQRIVHKVLYIKEMRWFASKMTKLEWFMCCHPVFTNNSDFEKIAIMFFFVVALSDYHLQNIWARDVFFFGFCLFQLFWIQSLTYFFLNNEPCREKFESNKNRKYLLKVRKKAKISDF